MLTKWNHTGKSFWGSSSRISWFIRNGTKNQSLSTIRGLITVMELFIIFGGAYALYTVGMAIAAQLDYREVNKNEK